MTDPSPTEFRHAGFDQVCRWGPSIEERVHGSTRLHQLHLFAHGLCRLLCRPEIFGTGWLPATGPVILAANHTSAWDGTLLFGQLSRPVSFLVKAEAFQPVGGLAGRVLIAGAQLPVRRQRIDPAPVRLAVRLLEHGAVVGICPEGRRGDGRVRQARPGVGYLAVKTGAPVVPVAIHGARAIGVHRPPVRIAFGAPISFPASGPGPLNRGRWLAATEQIRSQLAELVRTTAPEFGSGDRNFEKVENAD